jgi:DNA polymerase III alpha subunit
VSPRGMADKEGKADADYHHMILLARDDVGYRNLLALMTAAHLDGYYYKPRIAKELLARHSAGLIGTSACLGGEVLKNSLKAMNEGRRQWPMGIGPSRVTGTSSARSRSTALPISSGSILSSSSWRGS